MTQSRLHLSPCDLARCFTLFTIFFLAELMFCRGEITDRANRATSEQVLDPRTRMILFKLINRGLLNEINGCISTGKEANVYHASSPLGSRAVKVRFRLIGLDSGLSV